MNSTPTCAAMDQSEHRLLTLRLKATSRSFYLSVRVLPRTMRRPVGLAYLLARAADTLADSWGGEATERAELLDRFGAMLAAAAAAGTTTGDRLPPAPRHLQEAERALLDDTPAAFQLLASFPPRLRAPIRDVVMTLSEGMRVDLARFGGGEPGRCAALPSADDLDRYTYLIAGCVGEFWTVLTVGAGVWPAARYDEYAAWGVRFGKGLQLVNILRDVRGDFARGRVYLPADALAPLGLAPADLGTPASFERLAPLYRRCIETAREHFTYAQRYVCALPRHCVRLRLAAIWPLWIGLATLRDLAACPNPLAAPPIRIARREVYRMMAKSLLCAPSDALLRRVYTHLGGRS